MSEQTPSDPTRVPLIVGEVLQGIRSALDHLVGQLEHANNNGRHSRFEFPIFWDRARFRKEGQPKIRGVRKEVADVIERHQPFHRPSPSYRDHPLWILHDLNNADKHRVLIGTGAAITVDNLDIHILPGTSRQAVLAISSMERLIPEPRDVTATGERWTLSATFTRFGQASNHPIIPGLVTLHEYALALVDECRKA